MKKTFLKNLHTKRYNKNIKTEREAFLNFNFIYRTHAVERLFERNISEKDVEETIKHGKIIEEYLDDKPYPSFLVLGYEKKDLKKPLHVVFAKNGDDIIVITAYRPDKSKWSNNYQKRIN